MKKLLAIFLCTFTIAAFAATINFSWQNATQYTDGSPIATSGSEALASTVIEYGVCNADRTQITSPTQITTPYPGTSALADNLPPGTWCARARHLTVGGTPSAWTGIGSVVKAPRVPNPPSNFSIGS